MAEEKKGQEVLDLLKSNLGEIEKVLSTKTVVGEPTTIGDTTLIPLISVGFAVAAGGAPGKEPKVGITSLGTAGGAGVRPVGTVIIDKSGVRVEAIKGGLALALEKFADNMPQVVERWRKQAKE
jgi:uncharacterized spore protein YtfJ